MIVELRDGTELTDAVLLGAGNGSGQIQLLIRGNTVDGNEVTDWYDQDQLSTIHFDV